jgi:23S rRNA pseudouridine2605 synthase
MRIAKYISNAGICSRRDAEKLIKQKKVFINNVCCDHPSTKVKIKDKIIVNKKIVKLNSNIRLWKMYKPIKTICTNSDPQKRKTIFSMIPKNLPRLISIGRLDFMSEGLLLFTNIGDFARKYELPSSNIIRVYRVCINGKVDNIDLANINNGIKINNANFNKISVKVEKFKDPYSWLIFKMYEGKNREIRNICDYFLWNIVNLVRIQYGTIKLNKLKPGEIIEVKDFNYNT